MTMSSSSMPIAYTNTKGKKKGSLKMPKSNKSKMIMTKKEHESMEKMHKINGKKMMCEIE